jgi:hypothetical protein
MSTTRRSFLSALPGLAAASAVPTVLGSPKAAHAAAEPSLGMEGVHENPDLLQAHDALIAARAEMAEAQDALTWLADEWRHLWPLAPEELLWGFNAHRDYGRNDKAERDIIGRFMMRDTADLTKRLSRKYREKNEKQCFQVITSTEAEEYITNYSRQTPKGRTEKALDRNRVWLQDSIAIWEKRLDLALAYESETARLIEVSGVRQVQLRVAYADRQVFRCCAAISMIPAFTHEGLCIKARVLQSNELFGNTIATGGILAEIAQFIQSVLDVAQSQKLESAQ